MMDFVFSLFNHLSVDQDMGNPFGGVFTLFIVVFIVIFVIVVLTFALNFWRTLKNGGTGEQAMNQPASPPSQATKEIIREVVKIRCPYCGSLYDEDQDKCPNCGAKR